MACTAQQGRGREFPFLSLVHRILVKLENVNHSRPTSSALMAFEAGTASLRSCLHTLPVQPSPLHRPVDRLIALPDVELLSRARSMLRHDFVQELPSTVLVLTLLTQRQLIHLAPPCKQTLHDNLHPQDLARCEQVCGHARACGRRYLPLCESGVCCSMLPCHGLSLVVMRFVSLSPGVCCLAGCHLRPQQLAAAIQSPR